MTQPPERYTAVSLFTGAGGLDLGLEQAGFETISAVDADAGCVRTLLENQAARIRHSTGVHLAGTKILHADVAEIDAVALGPNGTGESFSPDLLAGGPPCQPFSSAGKMASVSDPRGRLFEHFVRLAESLKPKLILFENVRGLVTARGPKGEPGEVVDLVKRAFEGIGYATTFTLLNAADFGCPQRRVRCFMMATRRTALPTLPTPTHAETPDRDLFGGLAKWVSLRDYLSATVPPAPAEIVRPTDRLGELLRDVPSGSGLKSAGAREATRPGGHWGYRQGTFIADPDQPARTVTASASQDWIRLADGTLRRLTVRECAGLQGFPAEWQFTGPQASQFRQVGNAVPSVFGRVLGEALIDALRGPAVANPKSMPLPRDFAAAITYTKREQVRNGESRRKARQTLQKPGTDPRTVKGLGTADCAAEYQSGGHPEC